MTFSININLVSEDNIQQITLSELWSKKITNALDKDKIVVGCFLYLKKAFDTVNHRILISKLRTYD